MSRTRMPQPTLLALSAAAALLGLAAPVGAAPVLGASTTANAGATTGAATTTNSAGYKGSSNNASNSGGNSTAYSFASSSGAYAVRSNAQGIAASTAHASLLYTLVNSAATAQHYTMSFHIYGGSISTSLTSLNGNTASLSGGESLLAQYSASIKRDGTSVFSSTASTTRNSGGTSGTKSGTDLNAGDDGSDGYYSWSGGDYLVDLGVLAAGASMNVLAELDDGVTSAVGTYDFGGSGGYGYGYGCSGGYNVPTRGIEQNVTIAPPVLCFKGNASAFYGDPINFSVSQLGEFDPQVTFSSTDAVTAVPEPASLALAALALLGAGAATRRRTARPDAGS